MTGATDAVSAARARAGDYAYRDGVNEIGSGVGMIGLVGMTFMLHRSMTTEEESWGVMILALAGVALSFCEGPLKKHLRQRLTYPRIGYLNERGGEPATAKRKIIVAAIMAGVIILPLLMLVVAIGRDVDILTAIGWIRWLPLVWGPLMLVALLWDRKRFNVPRLWAPAILLAIVGPAASLSFTSPFLAFAVFYLAHSIINIVSGTVALITLVRNVPVAE